MSWAADPGALGNQRRSPGARPAPAASCRATAWLSGSHVRYFQPWIQIAHSESPLRLAEGCVSGHVHVHGHALTASGSRGRAPPTDATPSRHPYVPWAAGGFPNRPPHAGDRPLSDPCRQLQCLFGAQAASVFSRALWLHPAGSHHGPRAAGSWQGSNARASSACL